MANELITGTEEFFKIQHEVVSLYVTGKTYGQIAKELGMKQGRVVQVINEFKDSYVAQDVRLAKSQEFMGIADAHFELLIRKATEVIETVDDSGSNTPQMLAQKTAAIKAAADLRAKQIQIMREIGLLTDESELAEQLAKQEAQIMEFVEELGAPAMLCAACQRNVMEVAARVFGGEYSS